MEPWWRHAREHYLSLTDEALPELTTMYYDPALDLHHRLPARLNVNTALYAAPYAPGDARRLLDSALAQLSMEVPLSASRGYGSALLLAREWGLTGVEERLVEAIEASYGPTWHDGHFTWTMGLDEAHPRGQFNAFLAAAEAAGPGRWTALTSGPLQSCPQIVGVDFPAMALSRAEWIDGNLHLRLTPQIEDPASFTSFRLVGAEPRNWDVHGLEGGRFELTTSGLNIRVPMVHADLTLIRGSY